MITKIKDNFYVVTLPGMPCDKLLEYSNVLNLADLLDQKLSDNILKTTLFVFADTDTKYPLQEKPVLEVNTDGYKQSVLVWFGEESGAIPSDDLLSKFTYVFKAYMRKEYADKHLFAMPMILPGEVPVCDVIPISMRKNDVFFSGNLNRNRVPLYVALNKHVSWWEKMLLPLYGKRGGGRLLDYIYGGKDHDLSDQYENAVIRFNNGFNSGFSKKQYAALTSDSKIILSPRGFCSTECFRIYESMRQGCVVVCEELPKTPIYNGIPVVQVKNWKNIGLLIKNVLSDEQRLAELSQSAIKFYQERLSLNAIADSIIGKLNR